MKIGISYWGVNADFAAHRFETVDTPDGHRYGRPLLINALRAAGHDVFALQHRRERFRFPNVTYALESGESEFPDLDVIFLEWRWSTYKNDRRHLKFDMKRYEPDLDRQHEIIEYYAGKIPIIAWDTDLKMTPDDEAMYPCLIIADPSLNPKTQLRKRDSLPFWSDWKSIFDVAEPYSIYGYIGNNYERAEEFIKYYFSSSHELRHAGIETSMYGNWLQSSPEREPPKELIAHVPYVSFNHRMNFYDSMQMMNRLICTTHVSKPEYYRMGFISPRHLEAIACSCPGLIPSSQIYNGVLGREWIVSTSNDVARAVKKINELTLEQRKEVVDGQKFVLQRTKKFDVQNVVNYIESVKC